MLQPNMVAWINCGCIFCHSNLKISFRCWKCPSSTVPLHLNLAVEFCATDPFHRFSWECSLEPNLNKCVSLCWFHIPKKSKGCKLWLFPEVPKQWRVRANNAAIEKIILCYHTVLSRLKHGAKSSGLFTLLLSEMALCIPGVESDEVTVQHIETRHII